MYVYFFFLSLEWNVFMLDLQEEKQNKQTNKIKTIKHTEAYDERNEQISLSIWWCF